MKKSVIFIIITYIVAITFLILSTGIPGSDQVSTLTGPRQWPLILIIFMLILNTIFLINTIISKGDKKEKFADDDETEKLPENLEGVLSDEQKELLEDTPETDKTVKEGWKSYRHYILICLMILYLILLTFTNFLVATIIFFPLCSFLMGERNRITIAVSSVLATFLVYGLFEHLLNVPLP